MNVDQSKHAIEGWVAATSDELETARRNAEAWNRGDFEMWIENFAADCEWYPTTVGAVEGRSTPIHGHEALRAYTQDAKEVWELFQVVSPYVVAVIKMEGEGEASGVRTSI